MGVFETIRVRGGRMPFLAAHLRRLRDGAASLGLPAPAPDLARRLSALLPQGELVVRLTLGAAGEEIATRPLPPARPMRLARCAVPHRGYPVKSTERGFLERALADAEGRGADEALLATGEAHLAEGAISSVFFWLAGALCTPALDLGILPGIGRARLLEIARAAGIATLEGRFRAEDLVGAPLFLANAVRGVVEVESLDGLPVPAEPRTGPLAARFWG